MVICKYFLQGTCRFGSNCKFEHQLDDGHGHGHQTHSSVLRNQNVNQNNSNVDINVLVQSVVNDMIAAEKGGQWLLSCYTPFKEKSNFPGFEDKSFEEVRLGFYEAQQNGTADTYKQQLQWLLQETASKIKALQRPNQEAINIIRNIYTTPANQTYTNNSANIFNNTQGNPVYNSNNVFANNNQGSGFNSGTSIFGGQNNQQGFTNAPSANANSIFANASQKLFGAGDQKGSVFGTTAPTNNFGNTGGSQNIFSGRPNSQSIFNQSQQNPMYSNQNAFANTQQQNVFGNTQQTTYGNTQQNTFINAQQNTFGNTQQNTFGNMQQQNMFVNVQQQQSSSPFAAQTVASGTTPFGAPATVNMQQLNNPQQNTGSIFSNMSAMPRQGCLIPPPQQVPLPFGTQQALPFAQMPTTGPSVFSAQQPIAASAPNNIFGTNTSAVNHSANIFGSTFASQQTNPAAANTFGFANVDNVRDESIYSKMEDLSEADLKSFESAEFEFGKIPEKPPTIEMCF